MRDSVSMKSQACPQTVVCNSQSGSRVCCYTTCVHGNNEGSAWKRCIGIAKVLAALSAAMLQSLHVTCISSAVLCFAD